MSCPYHRLSAAFLIMCCTHLASTSWIAGFQAQNPASPSPCKGPSRSPASSAIDSPVPQRAHLFPFQDDRDLWGYMNEAGKTAIEPQFEFAGEFGHEALAPVRMGGAWAFIDASGGRVFSLPYSANRIEMVRPFRDERAWFSVDGLYGCLDTKGNVVVSPYYSDAMDFSEGLACVNLGGTIEADAPGIVGGVWNYIGKDGRTIVRAGARTAYSFSSGLAFVGLEKGYVDSAGHFRITIPGLERRYGISIESANSYSEGLAQIGVRTKNGTLHGYMDVRGRFVIRPRFTRATAFSENWAAVEYNDKWGFIDTTGSTVHPFVFDDAAAIVSGLAWVQVQNEWRIFRRDTRKLHRPSLEPNDVMDFDRGVARMHVGGTRVNPIGGIDYWRGGAWHYVSPFGRVLKQYAKDE